MPPKKKTIRTIPQDRTAMQEQDPQVRAKNFAEVACGYTLEEALREAERWRGDDAAGRAVRERLERDQRA